MGFWQLFVFIHVVELQSFSEAAKKCNLSQPTVSSHIKQLETYLECTLIDRIGKKALVTKVGEILYAYAKKLMALKEEAETAISDFQGNLRGKADIGGSTIPGVYIFPELLAEFRKRYTNISLSLEIDNTGTILQKIIEGALELGIVGAKSEHKSIQQQQIITDELKLIVPSQHRWSNRDAITFDTLKREPFIKREDSSGTWKSFKNSLNACGFDIEELNIVAEIKHTNGVISGIKKGLGVSVLSPIAIDEELKSNSLKALHIKSVSLKRNFYLTWNANRSFSPIIILLKEFIQKRFITT